MPWEVVKNYYRKVGFCIKSKFSSITRHNYVPMMLSFRSMKLVCKHCGHEIVNHDISGLSKKVRKALALEEKNKNPGDITIYLIYWRKNANNKWLKFPGLFYIGQTKRSTYERVYGTSGSHFIRAFTNPNCAIEHTIKRYGLNPVRAKKIFKINVLEIIPFQGSRKFTRKLANALEKFWIGFFHSQFYEFGRNIESGGSNVYKSIILPFAPLDEALYAASFLPRSGDFERRLYVCEKVGLRKTQNRILNNSLEFWYGFKSNRFIKALRLKRFEIIQNLVEQGYNVAYISKEINADRHDVVKWIENEIYRENYPDLPYKEIRKKVLAKSIIRYIRKGFTTPELLLKVFAGFQNTDAIKHFIRQNLGGWNNLINNYAPETDFWSIAKILLEKRKKKCELGESSEYTAVEFAHDLGSSANHTLAAIKYIKRKLNIKMTWLEIKNYLLYGKIPE